MIFVAARGSVMKIDPGLVIVFIAVTVFYLRLIFLQRERAKREARAQAHPLRKKQGKAQLQKSATGNSLLSRNRMDRIIAGAGVLAILAGVLLYTQIIPWPAGQPFWWLSITAGIVAFNWAFKL
jgi:hypothetical protein